jgi:hypothetical protein
MSYKSLAQSDAVVAGLFDLYRVVVLKPSIRVKGRKLRSNLLRVREKVVVNYHAFFLTLSGLPFIVLVSFTNSLATF